MLELWDMQSIHLLPSLPRPIWLGAVAPDRILSMLQIELTMYLTELVEIELFIYIKIDLALNNL